MKRLRAGLRHGPDEARAAFAESLAGLGLLAREALPALLGALRDRNETVRASAAQAVATLGPRSPNPEKAAEALVAALKVEKDDAVLYELVRVLRRFGPLAWVAAPALWKNMPSEDKTGFSRERLDPEAVALLGQLRPLPVETLAEIAAGERKGWSNSQGDALLALRQHGPRARLALLRLRPRMRYLGTERGRLGWEGAAVASAVLDISPEEAPGLVAPLLSGARGGGTFFASVAFRLLERCGAAARPHVPAMVALLDEAPLSGGNLLPLLGTEHRRLLPALRRHVAIRQSLLLADMMMKLGLRAEAIKHAARRVQLGEREERLQGARWLAKLGPEAKAAGPVLKSAFHGAADSDRARLALTLWRLDGSPGGRPLTTARGALEGLLDLVEGEPPAVGTMSGYTFWSQAGRVDEEEIQAVGAAVFTALRHLEESDDVAACLVRLLKDKRAHVRLAAAVALARLMPDHPGLVPELRRLLRDHTHFFPLAADTLAFLGPKAAAAAPELLPLLEFPHAEVEPAVQRVLRRLGKLPEPKWPRPAAGRSLEALWSELTCKDAMRADLAVRDMVWAGPRAVAFLAKRLKPPAGTTAKRVRQLLAELDSEDFDTRQKASAELSRHVGVVEPALRRALSSGLSLEVVLRVRKILEAPRWPGTPEYRRRLRCLRVLEEVGGREARALLGRLAKRSTPGGLPWEEARLALGRVGGR